MLEEGRVIWLTGLSGSGKSTLSKEVEKQLLSKGLCVKSLDGDELRMGINAGLGFSDQDRLENIRRSAEVAKLFLQSNFIVICSFITPFEQMRDLVKSIIPTNKYIEVYVKCSINTCEERDVKGLYAKARRGEIKQFTGVSSSFEEPLNFDCVVDTENNTIDDCVNKIIDHLMGSINE